MCEKNLGLYRGIVHEDVDKCENEDTLYLTHAIFVQERLDDVKKSKEKKEGEKGEIHG